MRGAGFCGVAPDFQFGQQEHVAANGGDVEALYGEEVGASDEAGDFAVEVVDLPVIIFGVGAGGGGGGIPGEVWPGNYCWRRAGR